MNGNGITVKELKPEDMPDFLAWGKHTDLRFLHYNFPEISEDQLIDWYHSKKVPFFRWVYAAKDEKDALLGYMTVKHIQRILRRAELGIVFDPARLGEGYGSVSLIAFLRIFFYEKKMKELRLRVAAFNHRAQRAYEKVGFVEYGIRQEPFEEQGHNFDLILNHPNDFSMVGTVLTAQFHLMRITREQFESLHGK